MNEPTLEERVTLLERRLDAICPNTRDTEFWIVQSEVESLAYTGPFETPEDAVRHFSWTPHYGSVVVELPRTTNVRRFPAPKGSS